MRQLKFRVWHKTSKSWHPYPGSLAVRVSDGVLVTAVSDKLLSPVSDEFIYQQFTGLLDKNGVEVFEGDLVSFTKVMEDDDEKIYKGQVIFQDCGCGFGYYIDSPTGETTADLYLLSDDFDIEVIGNIYQNPELLAPIK